MMLLEELSWDYLPITQMTRMKANLLNIKQGLKKAYSDSDIINFISKLDFIDTLADEHVQKL